MIYKKNKNNKATFAAQWIAFIIHWQTSVKKTQEVHSRNFILAKDWKLFRQGRTRRFEFRSIRTLLREQKVECTDKCAQVCQYKL